VHLRGAVAATAGLCAAATGHALDVSGRLPFVHESEGVRTAMTPAQVTVWLLAAAGLSALAARTRPWLVGAPAALAVSGTPELIGRHDPGALVEPGALLGALLQLLLVVAVVALAVALERRIALFVVPALALPTQLSRPRRRQRLRAGLVDRTAAPRAPPGQAATTT
jgi:hypothetical protein